jgi:transcriptional regulator with XRE-family HTH domain
MSTGIFAIFSEIRKGRKIGMKERIKELCKNKKISMNMLEQELGFGKGYISKLGQSTPNAAKIKKIADYFDVTVDYLMTGKEDATQEKAPELTGRDERDIEKILNNTREQLLSQEGLMFDGDPASPEAIDSILSAMQIGMEMAKKKNKEKYTPKKYKKD